jgi:hypothetical protein
MPKIQSDSLRLVACAQALCVAALCAMSGAAQAQTSSNTTVSGSMTVFQPITLTKTSDLSFGTIMRPASGNGTVTVDATSGARSVTGGAAPVASGGTPSRAAFIVTGEGGLNFTVSFPASFNMTRNGNQDPIQVSINSTMGGGQLSGSSGQQGTQAFGIGGQVLLSNGTPTGAYTGSFTVTVAYN